MRICLDTSAYSQFKRGDASAVEIISSARVVGVPSIVLGELRCGFRLGAHRERNDRELEAFLANASVQVLNVDDLAASHYADIVVALRSAGKPIPVNDIWIAALAAREGAEVVTYDNHFSHVQRVGVRILGH